MIVGVLGGGQLARMLALAGHPLGLRFAFLDPSGDACAFPLGEALEGGYDDPKLLERLAARAAVATYEFENVSAQSSRILSQRIPVYPTPEALRIKQDRLLEKQLFEDLGIPTAPFHPVATLGDLEEAVERLGLPLVLKNRSLGYDGKGQTILYGRDDVAAAWERKGGARPGYMAEQYIHFAREISAIAVRARNGNAAFYPIAENIHRQGILHISRARPHDRAAAQGCAYAARLLERFDYVGVLALEMFEQDGRLLANEFAPRVHNSGHWTIEGAETSQFENHLRAILGWPLGDTAAHGETAMVNCIGRLPEPAALLGLPGAHLHVYGKAPRPGRKVGHITLRAANAGSLDENLQRVCRLLGIDAP